MADWDADDFEPDTPAAAGTVPKVTDKWDGEDEDEDCKAAWDDSSEEEKEEDESKPVKVKKKKTLAQKIAEKEAAAEQARLEEEAEAEEDTPEAKLAAKMKMQRLAEEEDRELFKDLVGGVESAGGAAGVIDCMVPETKAEFETFGKLVADKFSSLEGSDHFQDFAANFIEALCRDQLNVATLKKVKQHADAFHSAKLKEEKNKGKAAAKKPEKKATLKMGRGNDHMSLAGGGFDDMDDFM